MCGGGGGYHMTNTFIKLLTVMTDGSSVGCDGVCSEA